MLRKLLLVLGFIGLSLSALPVVVFHGMGDQCSNSGMAGFTEYLAEKLNTYAVCIEIGNGATDSIAMNFHAQAQKACEAVKADARLQGDISVLGLSQGALLARSIIEQCDFNGTVRRYVSIGGPQAGVAKFPKCTIPVVCWLVNSATDWLVYTDYIQNNVGPAGYFKNPADYQKYLEKSSLLAELNNERANKSQAYVQNMLKLDKVVLTLFQADSMLFPKETAWFGFYNQDKSAVLNVTDTDLYKNDLIGLKGLMDQGKVEFVSLPGDHLRFSHSDIDQYFIPALQ